MEVTELIRIAICDDEEQAVALAEKIVKTCLQAQGVGYEITTYSQSCNLLCDIIDDRFFYDLILLDIEMPGISGMEIPQQVKEFLPNVRIIFVTSHTEYAIDAFELSIFRYVPKNNLETKLTAAVIDAAKLIELEAGQEYTIQTANRMEKIPYKDIFYIQRDGKNSSIVSSTGTSKVRKSLQQVFDELNAPEFIFTDRGYIVNVIQIMKISDSIAILKNGRQLPTAVLVCRKSNGKSISFGGRIYDGLGTSNFLSLLQGTAPVFGTLSRRKADRLPSGTESIVADRRWWMHCYHSASSVVTYHRRNGR